MDPLIMSGPKVSNDPLDSLDTCTLPPNLSLASSTVTWLGKEKQYNTMSHNHAGASIRCI